MGVALDYKSRRVVKIMIRKRNILAFLMGLGICRYFGQKVDRQKDKKIEIDNILIDILDRWMTLREQGSSLEEYLKQNNYKKAAIYGLGLIGNHLYEELVNSEIEIIGIDKADIYNNFKMPIYKPDDSFGDADIIIVTPVSGYDTILRTLEQNYHGKIVSFQQLLSDWETGSFWSKHNENVMNGAKRK